MTVIYRTAGAWGAGKGSNLTPAEVDGNFYDHSGRILTLETDALTSGIDYFTVGTDNHLYVHMTDHTIEDAGLLPVASTWVFRDAWLPSTAYAVNDVITANGRVYLVIFAHTSGSSFDSGANDGLGHNYYALILSAPAIPSFTIATSTFTPDISYANSYMRCTAVGGCAVTIPAGVFAPDNELHFRTANLTGMSLVGDVGVTLDRPAGFFAATNIYGATISLKQVDTDFWDVFGLLQPIP